MLNLGCGVDRLDGFVNIDIDPAVEPDIVHDVGNGLPFSTESVSAVRAFDFLEHLSAEKTIYVINEIWRVLEVGGLFEHHTPSTDGRGAYQDPTHRSFWNINSWLYFIDRKWSAGYGIESFFSVAQLRDIETSADLKIIHTYGLFRKERKP